jgi:hypothetical protein
LSENDPDIFLQGLKINYDLITLTMSIIFRSITEFLTIPATAIVQASEAILIAQQNLQFVFVMPRSRKRRGI